MAALQKIPQIWQDHIAKLKNELRRIEGDLKNAKDANAQNLRVQAEQIRHDIALFN